MKIQGRIKLDKKLVIVIVIAILIIVIVPLGLLGFTQIQNSNSTLQNNTTVQNDTIQKDTPSTNAIGIVATVNGPKTAKKGQNVTIEYTVSNKGAEIVYNMRVEGQSIDPRNIGTLKAGETRKFTEVEYIPTDAEVASDYGPGTTYMNPFPVGGDAVCFKDAKGVEHVINFDSIEIKLT